MMMYLIILQLAFLLNTEAPLVLPDILVSGTAGCSTAYCATEIGTTCYCNAAEIALGDTIVGNTDYSKVEASFADLEVYMDHFNSLSGIPLTWIAGYDFTYLTGAGAQQNVKTLALPSTQVVQSKYIRGSDKLILQTCGGSRCPTVYGYWCVESTDVSGTAKARYISSKNYFELKSSSRKPFQPVHANIQEQTIVYNADMCRTSVYLDHTLCATIASASCADCLAAECVYCEHNTVNTNGIGSGYCTYGTCRQSDDTTSGFHGILMQHNKLASCGTNVDGYYSFRSVTPLVTKALSIMTKMEHLAAAPATSNSGSGGGGTPQAACNTYFKCNDCKSAGGSCIYCEHKAKAGTSAGTSDFVTIGSGYCASSCSLSDHTTYGFHGVPIKHEEIGNCGNFPNGYYSFRPVTPLVNRAMSTKIKTDVAAKQDKVIAEQAEASGCNPFLVNRTATVILASIVGVLFCVSV